MKAISISLVIAASASFFSANSQAAGFETQLIQQPGEVDLTVGLWYPSDTPVASEPNTKFGIAVALNAPMGDSNGGLIVMSHGYGGWYAGHADTAMALADAGYIVAAPTHTGNTWSDMSSPVSKWVLDRPAHISRVLDHLLTDESLSTRIKPDHIGVYGFSAGGYTALGLIGGIPDFDKAQNHCRDYPDEFVCSEGLIDAMLDANMDELPDTAWGADHRIKAAAISAPAWGFAYSSHSLSEVTADVQLWSGMLDKRVPTETNAKPLSMQLPAKPETHWVENANHFAFLTVPCRESFKKAEPEEYKMVCGDASGFDRIAFHEAMHLDMLRFFDNSFGLAK